MRKPKTGEKMIAPSQIRSKYINILCLGGVTFLIVMNGVLEIDVAKFADGCGGSGRRNIRLDKPLFVLDLDLTLIDDDTDLYRDADLFVAAIGKIGYIGIWTAGNLYHLDESLKKYPKIMDALIFKFTGLLSDGGGGGKPCKFVKRFFTSMYYVLVDDKPENSDHEYNHVVDVKDYMCPREDAPSFSKIFNDIEDEYESHRARKVKRRRGGAGSRMRSDSNGGGGGGGGKRRHMSSIGCVGGRAARRSRVECRLKSEHSNTRMNGGKSRVRSYANDADKSEDSESDTCVFKRLEPNLVGKKPFQKTCNENQFDTLFKPYIAYDFTPLLLQR